MGSSNQPDPCISQVFINTFSQATASSCEWLVVMLQKPSTSWGLGSAAMAELPSFPIVIHMQEVLAEMA